jgi:DNA modification methylase
MTDLTARQADPPLLDRLATYTGTEAAEGHRIHNLHPYPAKYIPRLPREVIVEHTNERNTVLDPFCGSGTTLVEAALLGRKSVGIDSNPIATLATAAKTTPLGPADLLVLRQHLHQVATAPYAAVPKKFAQPFESWEHWFQLNMAAELSWLRSEITSIPSENSRQFAFACFSSIITSVSNQESDTRYKATDKSLSDGYAVGRYTRKLQSAIESIADYSADLRARRNQPRVLTADISEIGAGTLAESSVDLVVTSPPYPNSYDYYLYHKLRMRWLGFDYRAVQADEIGSRYEHSSRRAPIDTFITRIRPAIATISRAMKPSKLAYFFVGDSVIAGQPIDMKELYVAVAAECGLAFVDDTAYGLDLVSRSFAATRVSAGNSHGIRKLQRVLVFESRGRRLFATGSFQAKPASEAPAGTLDEAVDGTVVSLASDESSRHVHSIGYYPSKFIPEIPRWAISNFSRGDGVVLDPFVGSGTTAVEGVLAGRATIARDISPFAALLTRAKTTVAAPVEIEDETARLTSAASSVHRLEEVDPPAFDLADFWFNSSHLRQFARLRHEIETRTPPHLRDFYLAVLASTVRGFSYQDPAQIKVKRDAKKVLQGTPTPAALFAKRLGNYSTRLAQFNERVSEGVSPAIASVGSADRLQGIGDQSVDLVVTSPPYINAMNYPMAHKYELLLLGLVDPSDLIAHQQSYIGTERVYARAYRDRPEVPSEWEAAAYLNPRLHAIFDAEPKRARIAYDYFLGMQRSFVEAARVLRPGGTYVQVAGTNVIRDVPIDTFSVLNSLLRDVGFRTRRVFHYEIVKQAFKLTRHRTANLIPHDGVSVSELS